MRRRFLIALCSTLILTACSVPKSGPFETISNDDIPFGLNAAQTTAPQSATETTVANLDPPGTEYEQVDLYFIRNAAVTRAQRSVISPVDANGALAALTEGLVEDSTTVGLRSAIPASLEARVDVDRGVATVNATRVTEWEPPRVRVEIVVERESQKGMVIGKGGAMLNVVGTNVRKQLPKGMSLELAVVVDKNWQQRSERVERLGY